MASLYLKNFGGIQPAISPRHLPDQGAQVASNVKLVSGELRPLRKPMVVATTINPNPVTAIYQARNGDSLAWLTWQKDVDAVRGPLPEEVESRHYWTGDGEPRYGTFTRITEGAGNNYPSAFFALGIPNPILAPSVTVTGGAGSNTTRFYCYTFFSALGEESGPSPVSPEVTGRIDGTWTVAGMSAFPANSGTGTVTHASGISTFTNASSVATNLRAGDEVVLSGQTVTVLSTPAANIFTVAGNFTGVTSWARRANWNTAGMKRRLYRTTGTQGTFQMVSDDVGVSFTDTLTDANILGDELISDGWEPPSPYLRGLIVHPSGALMGFVGLQLLSSEPYQPHAWVKSRSLAMEFDIVGIASYGSEVAVTTKGVPYIVTGVEPESFTREKVNGLYPCLSKRSVVSVGDGVVYASQHGLVYLGASGSRILTDGLYTKDEWIVENPSDMVSAFAMGRLFMVSTPANGRRRILVLDKGELTTADIEANELYTDPATGLLFIATAEGIAEWDSPLGVPLTTSWKSKMFVSPPPINMAAAKIEFKPAITAEARAAIDAAIVVATATNQAIVNSGNSRGGINGAGFNSFSVRGSAFVSVPEQPASNVVSFTLFVQGEPIYSRVVTDEKAFRLPAGYKADELEIQVSSQSDIVAIRLADSMMGLKQI